MNRKNKSLFIFLLIIFYIIIYRVFVCTTFLKYNESISASFALILAFISYLFYGYRKIIPNYLNGKIINVDDNYVVSAISSGIVVFIGNKEDKVSFIWTLSPYAN